MWVKNFQNGYMSRLTHHIQSVMASRDATSYTMLNQLSSNTFDTNEAVQITNKDTGDFYIICGVSECGSSDKLQ
jgi:hypothetical protein